MSKYKASKITTNGQELLMQCLAKNAEMQFTRMAFGDGVYSSDTGIVAQNSLKNEKQSVSISSVSVKNRNSVVLSSILSNVELAEGYRLNEIGLFAKNKNDPTAQEILYAICIAEEGYADYLPAYNGYAPTKVIQDFYIEVADASSTTILADDNVTVSKAYLEANYYNLKHIDDLLEKKLDYKGIVRASGNSHGGNNLDALIDSEIEPGVRIVYYEGYNYLLMTFKGTFSLAFESLVQVRVKFRLREGAVLSVRSGTLDIQTEPYTPRWDEWQELAFKAGES